MSDKACLHCSGPNERWPYGLCPKCDKEQKRKDSAYADTLAHHAYLSHLAQRMMRPR